MDTSQRMVWLDALRLTAGVSMVVLHATADPNGQPWVNYPPADRVGPIVIRTIIYSARTELFLIISAFLLLLALEHRPRSYGQTVRQQMRRLLLPFAFWVVFYAGYNLIKADAFGYTPALLGQLSNPMEWVGFFVLGDIKYHMHFLPTLFGLVLFFPLFKCARRWPAIGFGVLVCLLVKRELDGFLWSAFVDTQALPYLVRAVKILTYVGYGLIAGAALGILEKSSTKQREAWLPILGFAATLLILVKSVGAWKTVQLGAWPHSYTAGFWADFLMPALLFLFCMCCGHWRWPAVISRIAPYSFGIYLCHPIFLDLAEVALRDVGWAPVMQVLVKLSFALPATTFLVIMLSRSVLFAWVVGLGPLPTLRRVSTNEQERQNAA
ncbi:acyltransferase [Actibacterium pelagium]|uniref:Acyltransferase 3 domain-containing protein n=1 Tax=Actibacterium pelagium TaxID=2029103 RepID=A0A917AJP7_9RHOB|nr:acyltransferase [Actibacterium pelagium]GGE54158.1 hypothetical protein GCM10011517_22190 [Actibacterium pelagium]